MYDMPKTAKIETSKAVKIGLTPKNNPNAIPPKAVCAIPSPIIASFRSIKKSPTHAQAKAAIVPPKSAFWKNWNSKSLKISISSFIFENLFTFMFMEDEVEVFAVNFP